ncbi:MAG: hypothetical protein WCG26_16380 [Chloroflexales bacterium]
MSETTGEVRVRNVRTKRSENLVESALEFGGGALRMGFSVLTLPLSLLPPISRQHIQNATKEFAYAFAGLPGELVGVASKIVDDWAADSAAADKKAPKDELTAG